MNGKRLSNGGEEAGEAGNEVVDESADPVERLQRELEKTREEKEALSSQYNTLLGKLTDMRTRLGTKLKQDAVCSVSCAPCISVGEGLNDV